MVGVILTQQRPHPFQIGLRLLLGDAGFDPPKHQKVVTLIRRVENRAKRYPDLRGGAGLESGRHDAHNRVTLAAQGDRLADDLPVAIEYPLPERMTDDDHAGGARLVFGRCESPAKLGIDTQNRKEIGRNLEAADKMRFIAREKVDAS